MKNWFTFIIFLLYLTLAHAQTAMQDSWITNGRVNNIATGDSKVMLMGEFDRFGAAFTEGPCPFSIARLAEERKALPKIEEEF
ncbi:MAG: hypothetical protein U5K54_22605 [Cytophagales bacterium]|nr:hypothetical protein [Cytophagales bacterium]